MSQLREFFHTVILFAKWHSSLFLLTKVELAQLVLALTGFKVYTKHTKFCFLRLTERSFADESGIFNLTTMSSQ